MKSIRLKVESKRERLSTQSKFLFLFIFSLFTDVSAVPPPPGFPVPKEKTCKVNSVAMQTRSAAVKAAPFYPVPLISTTAYVAVIRVDFSDQTMTKTKAEAEQFMEKLKNYYFENSYGLLTVSATVTNNVYRLTPTLATYAQGICSNYDQLAKDSVSAADADINFSNGASGGNKFNHIMIFHAGYGAETMGDSGCKTDNLWSVFAPTVTVSSAQTDGVRNGPGDYFSYDGVTFNGATIVPEKENQSIDPLGVICHEYGHQLGLPDLYKSAAQSVDGTWSLMDSGIYIGSPMGSNPAHLDAWCKQFLGFFSNPQTVTPTESGTSFSLGYALSASDAFLRIPISGVSGVDGNKEYFLVERRARSSVTGKTYDDALPFGTLSEGYLVWHIDDNIASDATRLENNSINSGSPHYGVDLVEADGGGAIATTSGKDSDPFPGSKGKTIFAAPLSNSFSGQQTGIVLGSFLGSGLVAKKAFASDSINVTRAINFPNPGGPSYTQKSGAPAGTVTTIVLHATRLPQKMQLTIHSLSGSLVRDIPETLFKGNVSAITTNKFVFEYDWDGRNGDGELVAPGVYLYRFKADDNVVKTGKLVIIR